jgi:hypothetical protein
MKMNNGVVIETISLNEFDEILVGIKRLVVSLLKIIGADQQILEPDIASFGGACYDKTHKKDYQGKL